MTQTGYRRRSHPLARVTTRDLPVMVAIIAFALAVAVGTSAHAQPATVTLGTAGSFGVLAGSTVTNTGPSVVNGDLGVSPGNAVTGFDPATGPGTVNGTIHAGDATAAQAQADLTAAYNSAAGRSCNTDLTGQDLGGLTLTTNVYCFSSSAQLTGTVVLDAQGDPNAVFIFQIGSTLTTASASSVSLINGAQACNVFWQVGSSATLGTQTAFTGNIMAAASITLNTGADIDGRALARSGAVTMDTNTVSASFCAAQPPPTETPTETPTATETPTGTPTGTETPTTAPTGTETPTTAPTGTETPTGAPTGTETPTTAPTATETPTETPPSPSPSPGPSPSPSPSPGPSPSPTPPDTPSTPGAPGGSAPPPITGGPDTGGGSTATSNRVIAALFGLALISAAGTISVQRQTARR